MILGWLRPPYGCFGFEADDPKGRFGFGSSSHELAETLEVSGGTHKPCSEVLTRV